MRYIAMPDPADQWLVYDQFTDLPAETGDGLLIGLSQAEAERLACEANNPPILLSLRHGTNPDKSHATRVEPQVTNPIIVGDAPRCETGKAFSKLNAGPH